ncbi:hypothetical protein H0H87_011541 [Tephrocybe sp. NHM501043]|nr:hypothetical protein H0H87_011541 [Tephrocybe sp. NHM501043]
MRERFHRQEDLDLGPLIGAKHGFRTRELVPGSGGLGGVVVWPYNDEEEDERRTTREEIVDEEEIEDELELPYHPPMPPPHPKHTMADLLNLNPTSAPAPAPPVGRLSAPATSFSPLSLASPALQGLAKSPRTTPVLGKDVLTHSMGGEGFWRAMEEGEERTWVEEGLGRGLEQ